MASLLFVQPQRCKCLELVLCQSKSFLESGIEGRDRVSTFREESSSLAMYGKLVQFDTQTQHET